MSIVALLLCIVVVPIAAFSIYVYRENKIIKQPEAANPTKAAKVGEPPRPVATVEPQEEQATETVPEVKPIPDRKPVEIFTSVKLVKKVRGKVLSTIATLMTIALWALIHFGMIGEELSLAEAIRSGFITNPVNLIGIAALVSGIGWWFDSPACMLMSGIALVAAVIFDITAWFVLIPAVMFGFAAERLVPEYSIQTTKKKI